MRGDARVGAKNGEIKRQRINIVLVDRWDVQTPEAVNHTRSRTSLSSPFRRIFLFRNKTTNDLDGGCFYLLAVLRHETTAVPNYVAQS